MYILIDSFQLLHETNYHKIISKSAIQNSFNVKVLIIKSDAFHYLFLQVLGLLL